MTTHISPKLLQKFKKINILFFYEKKKTIIDLC